MKQVREGKESSELMDRLLELSFFIEEHVHFQRAHFWSVRQAALSKSRTIYLSIQVPRAFRPVAQMLPFQHSPAPKGRFLLFAVVLP